MSGMWKRALNIFSKVLWITLALVQAGVFQWDEVTFKDLSLEERDSCLKNRPSDYVYTENMDLEFVYEEIVSKLAGGLCTLYAVNLIFKKSPPCRRLQDFPLNTDPVRNKRLGKHNYGISISSWYFGWPLSFTLMHVEDSDLDSFNLHLGGAPKLWLVVPRSFRAELDLRLAAFLKQAPPRIRKAWRDGRCPSPLKHKDLFITPDQLRRWGVAYELFLQWPGQGVFIPHGVPHQVINLGENVAEAVNPGWPLWNPIGDCATTCGCEGCSYRLVASNEAVLMNARPKVTTTYDCPHRGCPATFRQRKLLSSHLHVHPTKEVPVVRAVTADGTVSIAASSDAQAKLSRSRFYHVDSSGTSSVKKSGCPRCGRRIMHSGSFNRHVKNCGKSGEPCGICGVVLKASSKAKHRCRDDTDLVCSFPNCGRRMKTLAALVIHRRFKHPFVNEITGFPPAHFLETALAPATEGSQGPPVVPSGNVPVESSAGVFPSSGESPVPRSPDAALPIDSVNVSVTNVIQYASGCFPDLLEK